MNQIPPKFEKFQMVRLRREPTKSGVVWGEPIPSDRGWQYEIFFSGDDRRFVIEHDIETLTEHPPDEPGHIRFGDINDLLRSLLLIKLRTPLADHLYGLYASRTKFEVYQFKPAQKFLGNPDQRILIADEVGLGKTIEAGIIYLELQARMDLTRVLVVCPPALKYKWQDEMRSRFDENFTILDREKLDNFLDDYAQFGENTRLRGIVTLHLIRRTEIAARIADLHINFDLVIIDEAHHMRNPATLSNQVGSVLSDFADAMLMLTATPLHLGNQDLFHLLQILAPGEFDNLEAFRDRIEPNKHINRASQYLGQLDRSSAIQELRKIERYPIHTRFERNPYYLETVELLEGPQPTKEGMIKAQRNLLELNTLAHIFTRTRKREVVVDPPVRAAHSLIVEFSPEEREFYDGVIQYVRQEYRINQGGWISGWVTMMRERQAASCITAVRGFYEQLLNEQYSITREDIYLADELTPDEELGDRSLERIVHNHLHSAQTAHLEELVEIGNKLGNTDTKFDLFQEALQRVLEQDTGGKILIFSFFRATLDYLYRRLSQLGYRVNMIHGGVDLNERKSRVEQFRDDPDVNILLSSEVGSEGLDFQFCHTLFNYDLPWNPMKVEQRIGRLDRFGQEHERINIYNLLIENSIEERIFLRLYERIGIFQESIGDLEAILGEEIRYLSNQLFSRDLTPNQENDLAEQASHNIIRRKQEMEEFEQQRLQFMGQDAIFADEVQTAIEAGKFISESEIQALVETFVKEKFPRTRLKPDYEDPTFALSPGVDFNNYLRDFVIRTRNSDQTALDFLRRLNEVGIIPLTFSADIAYQRKLVEFITIRHPITLAAISYWQQQPREELPVYKLCFESSTGSPGDYFFFIMLFHSEGMQQNSQLVPILLSRSELKVEIGMGDKFMQLLQFASQKEFYTLGQLNGEKFDQAKTNAKKYAAKFRDQRELEMQHMNDALVNARLTALEQTYQIKSSTVQRYLETATDTRIVRMRKAQLRNIEAKYLNSVQELEKQRDVSVSFSLELAGLVRILHVPDEIELQ
jgi:SNF2 family DNA or RNA helicase